MGKSSITLALVAALRRRGLKVQTFKVGPDYLDPGHLAQVSGRPCYNLDGWMTNQDYVRQLFYRQSADADISLIEGVMGLFDGSSSDSLQGSSGEISAWLKAPVALVVNSHGMARSIAALVKGYNEFSPQVSLAGVIANRSGSASHTRILQQALASAGQPSLLGAVQRDSLPVLKSRHLGLISAHEQSLSDELISQLADAAESQIELDLLLAQARSAEPLSLSVTSDTPINSTKLRLAVAQDEAFQFYYADLFPALKRHGCSVVPFSPLRDSSLPVDIDGLYLGGGYPEIYAQQLAENSSMIQAVADFCGGGKPVYAECGGLIYLTQGIDQAGEKIPLVGALPVWARMLEKRKALGYVEVTLKGDSLFGRQGDVFRGHEFHYSELIDAPVGCDGWQSIYELKQNRSGKCFPEGYQKGNILASYAHLHLASQPKALQCFVETLHATSQQVMDKYQGMYRIKTARLKDYDYASAGIYFITICTANREHHFGKIINDCMELSQIGTIAVTCWEQIVNHSKNVKLHDFIVMPNHIHGLLEILGDEALKFRDVACNVSTEGQCSMAEISPAAGTVGRIIGGYKAAVTKHVRRLGCSFAWQPRFYDHIIRNEESLRQTQQYIIDNPVEWRNDELHG